MRSIKNFRWILGLGLALVAGMSTMTQASTTIVPTAADEGPINSFSGYYHPPAKLIDGSGLSGAGDDSTKMHDNDGTASDMWVTIENTAAIDTETVTFTLPANFDLGGAYIWNYNQAGLSFRGVKDFTIDISTDGTSFTPLGTTFTLTEEPGTGPISAQTVPFFASNVVKVRFDILTTFQHPTDGSVEDNVGLSEVRFFTAPEPASLSMLTVGGVMLLRRRGRRA